jgi:hypothetical protein
MKFKCISDIDYLDLIMESCCDNAPYRKFTYIFTVSIQQLFYLLTVQNVSDFIDIFAIAVPPMYPFCMDTNLPVLSLQIPVAHTSNLKLLLLCLSHII